MLDRYEASAPQAPRTRSLTRVLSAAVMSLSLFAVQLAVSATALAQAQPTPSLGVTNPSLSVNPSWEGAPWEPKVHTILNVTAQAALACCVLALLIGGAAMAVGRVVGSYQSGTRGLQFVLGGAGGALVIASASAIVSWLVG